MKLKEIVKELNLKVITAKDSLDKEVIGGYASDLLSDVIANSKDSNIWVTLQIHQNIVAVASMKNLSGIILVNAREPEKDTVEKAEQENIAIMASNLPAFEVIGRLYALGICGKKQC
ncbi:MAG: serine kinase [Armatimonadetes bacterium CG07_land_8_20_14_0_80_40_9]|nr:MAG: serine kinase [Armatimonadetes bacterium CG07_land_8_20_14_0_80_40_9]